MKRVLITGARGFLGRHCLTLLLVRGYEVHAVSRLANRHPLFDRVAWHESDLLTPGSPASPVRTLRPAFVVCALEPLHFVLMARRSWITSMLAMLRRHS